MGLCHFYVPIKVSVLTLTAESARPRFLKSSPFLCARFNRVEAGRLPKLTQRQVGAKGSDPPVRGQEKRGQQLQPAFGSKQGRGHLCPGSGKPPLPGGLESK